MPPSMHTDFWDNVGAHVKLLEKNNYIQSACLLTMYEDERKRQVTAINNLETQLTQLAASYREKVATHRQLVGILKRAGMDMDTLIRTDDIFGDP